MTASLLPIPDRLRQALRRGIYGPNPKLAWEQGIARYHERLKRGGRKFGQPPK